MQSICDAFVSAAFEDTIHHPDLSIEVALSTIKLARQHDRSVKCRSREQCVCKSVAEN